MASHKQLRRPILACALLALLAIDPRPLQAQLTATVSPAATPPGSTVPLRFQGANLTGPLTIWTSFPATVDAVTPAKDGKSATATLTVPPGTTPQLGGLLVSGRSGVSAPLAFFVDDLPTIVEATSNHERAQAQPIPFPAAVDGRSDGVRFDYFRVSAKQGQTIAMEVYAQRIQSPFDPVLRLLTADGSELAAADDTPGLAGDCALQAIAPADGDYLIEVHDNQYRAGGRYRLRVGDFPVNESTIPLAVRRGSIERLSLGARSQILAASGAADGMAIVWPGDSGSALQQVLLTDLPEYVETEPNDNIEKSEQLLVTPCGWSGRIDRPGDVDTVRFLARKAMPVYIETLSSRLGSPTRLAVAVLDSGGKQLAASSPGPSSSTISFTPPTDGEYRLQVRELLNRGGPRWSYRVQLSSGPDFRVNLKNDKTATTRQTAAANFGAAAFTVECERRGFEGPVKVSLQDPPPGFQLLGNEITAKESRVIVIPPRQTVGRGFVLRLQATAEINGVAVTRPVGTLAVEVAKQPAYPLLPAWRDGLLAVAVGADAKPFFELTAPESIPAGKEAVTTALTFKRTEKDFKAGLRLFVAQPAQLAAAGLSLKPVFDKDKVTVQASATTAAGDEPHGGEPHNVTLHAVAEHKGQVHVRTVKLKVVVKDTPAQTPTTNPPTAKP